MATLSTRQKIIEVLQKPVWSLPGVGTKVANLFARLEIENIYDLLNYFPRTWLDLRKTTSINGLKFGELAIIQGKPEGISFFVTKNRRLKVLTAKINTPEGLVSAFWFNQVYLNKTLENLENGIFVGKFEYNATFGRFISNPQIYQEFGILPIYSLTRGLGQNSIRKAVKMAISAIKLKDFFNDSELDGLELVELNKAINNVHNPRDEKDLVDARSRLAFNEMFYVNYNLAKKNANNWQKKAQAFEADYELIKKYINKLPFKLTGAQKREIYAISQELAQNKPMQRLLQGDVGSGKTLVAALSAIQVVKSGKQVVCMAPTEILARQHFETFSKLFASEFSVALVVSSEKHDWKKADIIIGTSALIQKSVKFTNLGFVIIDEQHRFGTNQRNLLIAPNEDIYPHYLAMSATPIPRSLAQIIYGQLTLGRIDEMPPGRKLVKTKIFLETERQKVYTFVDKLIEQGEQIFIVCPRIEPTDALGEDASGQEFLEFDKKSAIEEYEKLQKSIFSHRKIALLHGKMKTVEKNKILDDFRDKKYDLLVSTSVIEVGIDIPNASAILIESAERFGLAQLHQFRGRVGRSGQQGYCFLNIQSQSSLNRLQIMEKEFDGFKLAEFDLKQRGPGDFIGARQSGLPDFKMAEFSNIVLLEQAKQSVDKYILAHKDGDILLDYYAEEFFKRHKV